MARYPGAAQCRRLLEELGASADVVAHCERVAQVATLVALAIHERGRAVDVDLVVAGAHLHDAGRAFVQDLRHAGAGAEALRERGLPEALCRVVERHTGGGIEPDEAAQLGLPVKDYTPRTLEEKIVCASDNLVDGARRQKVQEELAHLRSRGLERVAAKVEALHGELSVLAGRDLDRLV